MLVLTRKLLESIVVDGCITITVIEIRGGRIKLGIEAPKEVGVRRSELEESTAKRPRPLSDLHGGSASWLTPRSGRPHPTVRGRAAMSLHL
jgi:carbon storage regulator